MIKDIKMFYVIYDTLYPSHRIVGAFHDFLKATKECEKLNDESFCRDPRYNLITEQFED